MRQATLLIAACAVLACSGCMATRDIPSDQRQGKKVAAVKDAFTELNLGPVVDEQAGTVTSRWSWCGDRSPGALVAMFPLTWARYKATATSDKITLAGEAWGANGLLLFGILPGALVNVPLPFPMEQVEDKIAAKLKD